MALRRVTLADLAPGSNVTDIILRGGQAQAEAELRGGDAMANAIGGISQTLAGGLQQYGQERRQQKVQDAVRVGTSRAYPSATWPVPGSAADIADPGSDHLQSILSRLSPEDRPLAMKGIQDIEMSSQAVRQHNLQIEELQGKLKDAEMARTAKAKDYGATLGKQISAWLPKQDGGLSAALFGLGNAKEMGTQGLEEIEPVLGGLAQEWEAAVKSGDPAAMAAAAEKNRATIGPIAEQLQMGASEDWLKANRPPTRVMTKRNPDGSTVDTIVEDKPGVTSVSAPEPPKIGSFDDYVVKKYGRNATPDQIAEARRVYGQADDRARDPALAELARLRLEDEKAKRAGAQTQGDTIADAWAAGTAFPSTQEATTQALASFQRRGLPVPRKLSAPMQQEAIRSADALATIEDVRQLYAKVKDKVGPVSYTLAEFSTKIPGIDSDPDFVAFNTMLRSMGNLEIKRVTGAQMSEAEADRLLKGMATGKLKPGDFEAALGIMERNVRRNRDILVYGKSDPMGGGAGAKASTGRKNPFR